MSTNWTSLVRKAFDPTDFGEGEDPGSAAAEARGRAKEPGLRYAQKIEDIAGSKAWTAAKAIP